MSKQELMDWATQTLGFHLDVYANKKAMLERLARLSV